MSPNKMKPLVSIVMITYNHEEYITEAIDGVLMQENGDSFDIELIIADDCSLDRKEEIVRKYITEHPRGNWIKYHRQQQNIGMMPNFVFALKEAKGEYIALCEGDDYWTDPLKLQKQVDFLEANADYAICFHPVQVLKNGVFEKDDLRKVGETTSIEDLAKGNYIHTPSVVFRNGLFNMMDPIFYKVPAGDYLIHMLNARKGLIKKLDEPMAVYRKHENGIWSSQSQMIILKRWIYQMDLMIPVFKDFPDVSEYLLQQKKDCKSLILKQNSAIKFLVRIKDSFIYRLFEQRKNKALQKKLK